MRPRLPVTIPLLGLVVAAGLVALFMAALYAFNQVTVHWIHAAFAAALIETAIVFEAVTFTRNGNKIALVGLILSFMVSMLYNYVQASLRATQLHSLPIIHEAMLLALAIGPLSALAFVGLALGNELKRHALRVEAWEAERQRIADEAEAFERTLEHEKAVADIRLADKDLEHRHKMEEQAAAAAERARKREERRRIQAEKQPEPNGNLPEWITVQPTNRFHFRQLVEEGEIVLPAERPSGAEMVAWFDAVNTDRTGRLWTGDFYEAENGSVPKTR